jgi:ferritin-like metal-binding protein YciE
MKQTMKTLQDLFIDELADMYDAEHRLMKALPKLAKAATHQELREAIQSHLQETEGHASKLEEVFAAFGAKAKAKKCEAIVGLLEESDDIASENKGSPTINAALISAAQKVEHYEIASYGTLHEWAKLLGNNPAASLLEEILDEEKTADQELTKLARTRCNESATEEAEMEVAGETGDGRDLRHRGRAVRPAKAARVRNA